MIISIIGYGAIGKHYLNILKNYKNKKISKILVFDTQNFINPKDKSIKFLDIRNLNNYLNQIDLSIIATPSHLHFKYSKIFFRKKY